ncbi:hypothetical protein FGU65_02440 [Methanoculleus sp. FWC-SCC1]|uniref:L-2-amino-thiazoline-4-carboxylic acid hydrolase n=1 Tax=Methanoculleus frigidifontis TaxID=2584085 RepID=A0ABT8M790_9EURY|nr:hypothetical protein [Methanoculleus sp. FWC-SCC1]MDN7023764.1 hypothetical protein [Methanoculleus sp. FWC-SCC1]
MLHVKDIPEATRWEMATHVLGRLVLALGQEAESETAASFQARMFSEMGQEIRAIADRYGLPRGHAADIVQTLGIVSVVLFGPAFTTRFIEGFPEESVIRLTDCAMFREESAHGISPLQVNSVCQAYVGHAVEALNPEFSISITRARCRGDAFCEMVIERRKP